MKTVIVLGRGILAIRVAEWFYTSTDYKLIAIVPVVPEEEWSESFINWAHDKDIEVVTSGDYHDLLNVMNNDWNVDLIFSVFYTKIIKPWFLQKCSRALNIHPGPLPRYRGLSVVKWALKNGENEHGITIHELTSGIDDGPIIAQLKFSIYPYADDVIDVYRRIFEYGWVLFSQTIPMLNVIQPIPQDHSAATYYSKQDRKLLGEWQGLTRSKKH